jgi:hypothetical protein
MSLDDFLAALPASKRGAAHPATMGHAPAVVALPEGLEATHGAAGDVDFSSLLPSPDGHSADELEAIRQRAFEGAMRVRRAAPPPPLPTGAFLPPAEGTTYVAKSLDGEEVTATWRNGGYEHNGRRYLSLTAILSSVEGRAVNGQRRFREVEA